jgi:hypothetical protein
MMHTLHRGPVITSHVEDAGSSIGPESMGLLRVVVPSLADSQRDQPKGITPNSCAPVYATRLSKTRRVSDGPERQHRTKNYGGASEV